MTPFQAAVRDATAAVDAVFAHAFAYQPMKAAADVNAPPVPDTGRAAIPSLPAIITTPPAKPLIVNAYDPRADQRPGTQSQHPVLKISPGVAAAFALRPRRDDLFTDAASGQIWRVSSARTTTHGIVECIVNIVG